MRMTRINWEDPRMLSHLRRGRRQHYGGRVMRSALEVRWAQHFDARGDTYIYEPENLRSPSGWLPDFAVNPGNCGNLVVLVEVKPSREVLERDRADWYEYYTSSEYNSVIVVGDPGSHQQLYGALSGPASCEWEDWCTSLEVSKVR